MFELDKNNFAKFLTEQRKAKGYTQKVLAEKLYVSDKAVSKWERSLSMPDISLLIPLAEILGVSVTELLEGRRLAPGSEMNAGKVEELVKKALTLSEETPADRQLRKERQRKNAAVFCSCTLLMLLESLGGVWLLNRLLSGTESDAAFMASLGGFISIFSYWQCFLTLSVSFRKLLGASAFVCLNVGEYLQGEIDFEPKADMFCAYSGDTEALADFILRFKKTCEEKPLISDLFSKAELD